MGQHLIEYFGEEPLREPEFTSWIALDMSRFDEEIQLVSKTHMLVRGFTVYSERVVELQTAVGALRMAGARHIWWDRTWRSTLYTVAEQMPEMINAACELGVDRVSVLARSGIECMLGAAQSARYDIEVVAITMPVPADKRSCIPILSDRTEEEAELLQAWMAKLAGVSGIVCSAEHVGFLDDRRRYLEAIDAGLELDGLNLIVSGSRNVGKYLGGRLDPCTAASALQNGADELIFSGRMLGSRNPTRVFKDTLQKMQRHRAGHPG